MTIEVDERTAQVLEGLRARAAARQIPLDAYLAMIASAGEGLTGPVDVSVDELDRLLDELQADLPPLPTLPDDFSRADIYDGHD